MISIDYLHDFVKSKYSWILKQMEEQKKSINLSDPDSKIIFLGKRYPLSIDIDNSIKKGTIDFNGKSFHLKLYTTPTHEYISDLRDSFYRDKCKDNILPIVDKWSSVMSLSPSKISFRKAKTRWGSCSPSNSISLNTRLMMLPIPCIEYIIIHELAHIRYKNHSSQFWDLVKRYDPIWKEKRSHIREYEKLF